MHVKGQIRQAVIARLTDTVPEFNLFCTKSRLLRLMQEDEFPACAVEVFEINVSPTTANRPDTKPLKRSVRVVVDLALDMDFLAEDVVAEDRLDELQVDVEKSLNVGAALSVPGLVDWTFAGSDAVRYAKGSSLAILPLTFTALITTLPGDPETSV